ncbi:DNA-3-methyladenine glycosylase family protein [Streptomyces sp. 4N124]|uniref:DNA-3-methyladenine glycosylase family protein n=1 Tax=Streptomyces sp. 4N124 TaxID=3457420 RepID=UPI003FD0AE73
MRRQSTTAYRHLAADPVLDGLIASFGRPDPFDWAERDFPSSTNFEAMALHIVGQQISIAAALTIFARVTAAVGGAVTPESLLALADNDLRACGLSRAKAAYLHDLAQRQVDGAIDLEHMDDVDDATALTGLTAVHGVGLWSAQMFLIHQLERPDILPAGDVGIRRAIQNAWHLTNIPSVEETRRRATAWAPYRTCAAALLWASLRNHTALHPTVRP